MKRLSIAALAMLVLALMIGCSSESSSEGDSQMTDAVPASAETMAVATVGEAAPDFTLMDTKGNAHSLSDFEGKYVVLEWVNFDCPFVKNHYVTGNMPSLQAKYTDTNVVWLSICSSAPGKQGHFKGDALTSRMAAENWAGTAYLIDADGKVGKMYDAKTTPHMYIIDPEGMLRYAGAIDDTPSTKADDLKTASNYVSAAMDNLMAGKPVATNMTKAYGCSVKYP